jgi:ribose transport system ATP-binding protein
MDEGTAPALSLAHISKSFGGVRAIEDVSFTVHPGRVVALLGENGAGKSTLMGVASGTIRPDAGEIEVSGTRVPELSPAIATRLGVAIVHQHPTVLPDLTVAENLRLAVPPAILGATGDRNAFLRALLKRVGASCDLSDRVEELSVAQRHLVEVAKAIAVEPRVLVLDEPTAPLGASEVELLFEQVRRAKGRGNAVVYITHRLAEVRQIADEVVVMRDGKVRGRAAVSDVSDGDLLKMIVGRTFSSTFPPKAASGRDAPVALRIAGYSGADFHDVALEARAGEVVGLAGIVGNGQSRFLKSLAGLEPATGDVVLDGTRLSPGELRPVTAYMPADRHVDGLFPTMSVRENMTVRALPALAIAGLVSRPREARAVQVETERLAIRASSAEASVMSLSGGNQQKVVMARALLSSPRMLLADEPTQGVDVGGRAEIYRILRGASERGIPVVVASSDAKELEGLCDRVLVFSRGHVVEELSGDAVTEEGITAAAVKANTHRRERPRALLGRSGALLRLVRGDYAPSLFLALVILALGAYTYAVNTRYLAPFNLTSVLTLLTALGFIALGQTIVIMTGGIDLSVGPLAGLLVVIASFFVNEGRSAAVMWAAFLLMLVVAAGVGLVNGLLVRFGGFTPVAATLTLYIALQGVSLLLRPFQDGYIDGGVTSLIGAKVHWMPVAFIVAGLLGVGLELLLRLHPFGRALRAVGSHEASARALGVPVDLAFVLAYVACSVLTFGGAVMLMAQIGVGDPVQGVGYTITSITAVVLGGASLLGGRGSFIGTLLGAALIQQILNATTFLNLGQTWQYFFQGALILVAAALYTRARIRSRAAALN